MVDYSQIKAAYDNSPIGFVLLEECLENNKPVDLVIRYINELGAYYWGATPDKLTDGRLLAFDERADRDWVDIHQELQATEGRRSLYYYSPALDCNLKLDCFFYGPGYMGCYIRDAEFEAGKLFTSDQAPDNRPMTDMERTFAEVTERFVVYDNEAYSLEEEDDFIVFSDLETNRIIKVIAANQEIVDTFLAEDDATEPLSTESSNYNILSDCYPSELLHKNRYHMWTRYSNRLSRDYLHKTKLVKFEDVYVRMDTAQDISSEDRKATLLAETLEGMSLWTECLSILSDETPLEDAIKEIIKSVGEFYQASSGVIMLYGPTIYSATWAAEGEYPVPPMFANPTPAALKEWGSMLRGRAHSAIADTANPSIPEPLQDFFQSKGIHSTQMSPLFVADKLKGVLCLNNMSQNRAQAFIADIVAQSVAHSFHQFELQEYANRLRFRDSLTGYLNFEGFRHTAEALIEENDDQKYSLWYSDIRRFKYINDMFGYEIGDGFLKYWTDFISGDSRGGETFCRVSADNIIVLRRYEDEKDLSDRFACVGSYLAEYPGLKEKSFKPELVSGVYLLDEEDMRAPDINAMLNKANIAQKSIKNLSGSRMAIYDDSLKQKQLRELEISQHLETGLEKGEFFVMFQPQFKYTTNEIVGAEALVRWSHPELGNVSPGEFIPLLEKAGLISELDMFVWEEACRFVRSMIDDPKVPQAVPISVNISRIDIYLPDLGGFISGLVEKYDIPTSLLKLEITESAYIADSRQLIEVVDDLRDRGFSVEMDDFGSGYSSLNILKDVPVDVLKLDMRFLAIDDTNNRRGGNILSSVIRMAHWIGLPVIAEGVETKEQADYLKDLGCYIMQGYYFAKPMLKKDFEALLVKVETGDLSLNNEAGDILGAVEFLEANGATSYIFNNCIGGACLIEYGDENFEALLLNDQFYESLGITREKADEYRTHMLDLFIGDDKAIFINGFNEAVEKGSAVIYVRTIQEPGEPERWIRGTNHYLASSEGRHMLFAVVEDVTKQYLSEMRLSEIESELNAQEINSMTQRWQSVQYHVMAGLQKAFFFDYDIRSDAMVYCIHDENGHAQEVHVPRYITDKRFERVYPDDREKYEAVLRHALSTPTTGSTEFRSHYLGSDIWGWCRVSFVSLEGLDGKVNRLVGRIDDIEDEKQLQQQINRDALTGFFNQSATKSMISAALEEKQQGALFVIDIDDFKGINDTLGHLFGDSFLREASVSLGKAFRDEDVLGRIGGDEFVAFVPGDLDLDVVERKAQSVLDAFSGIEIPQIGSVHASVGVSMVEADTYHDYATLFKKADRALYAAKHKGKNCYVLYQEGDSVEIPLSVASRRTDDGATSNEATWPHTLSGDVFSILYHEEQTCDGINDALAHVGRWLDVSRVYIFEKRDGLLSNTFEWCNTGIDSEIANLQNIPDGDENGENLYIENFDMDSIFYLRYAEDAPEWQREILEPQGIKSMLQYGIMDRGDLFGFIGFDECNENVFWTKEQIDVLVRIAQMVAVFLKQLRESEGRA